MTMTGYFHELMRMRQLSTEPLVYECLSDPEAMGNNGPIAYGGHTLGLVIQAASHAFKEEDRSRYSIYSLLGNYLGPTQTDRKVQFTVQIIRMTRSFATFFVLASQTVGPKGSTTTTGSQQEQRNCFSAIVDFAARLPIPLSAPGEPGTLPLSYSFQPSRDYPPPEEVPETIAEFERRAVEEDLNPKLVQVYRNLFEVGHRIIETKMIPGGVLQQTLLGVDKARGKKLLLESLSSNDTAGTTVQKENDTPEKCNAEYFRAKNPLSLPPSTSSPSSTSSSSPKDEVLPFHLPSLHASLLAFYLDGTFGFFPLSLNGLFIPDAGACSSLEVALRFYTQDLSSIETKYHLKEIWARVAGEERTFNEANVWIRDDNEPEGERKWRAVAGMTQQCVLRGKKKKAKI